MRSLPVPGDLSLVQVLFVLAIQAVIGLVYGFVTARLIGRRSTDPPDGGDRVIAFRVTLRQRAKAA
jgi:predicted Na+-dependent transporter